jgi:uncharacterized protein YoxC
MSSASEILVIILSVFLAIFLLLGIILSIYLIKLTKDIREVTQSATRTVNNIESAVGGVAKLTSPLFVAEMIGRYIKKFKKSEKKGE